MICVPIDAICTSGAASRPVKKMYMTKSPSVIVSGEDRAAADEDHHHADDADDDRRRTRSSTETPVIDCGDVAEQLVDALREDELLALLGGVGLDDADAAERLRSAGR